MAFTKMAGSIKLFLIFRKFHQFFGIDPSQSNQKLWIIDCAKIILFLINSSIFMCATVAFLLFEAKSMFDYGFVFFSLISTIDSIAFYLIFIWQSQNTFKFIEHCEGFIKKSKRAVL